MNSDGNVPAPVTEPTADVQMHGAISAAYQTHSGSVIISPEKLHL